tara:strand:+ start:12808 stop:13107 length:300 start_codon:yes stop_codon:yes gene_type:complete
LYGRPHFTDQAHNQAGYDAWISRVAHFNLGLLGLLYDRWHRKHFLSSHRGERLRKVRKKRGGLEGFKRDQDCAGRKIAPQSTFFFEYCFIGRKKLECLD